MQKLSTKNSVLNALNYLLSMLKEHSLYASSQMQQDMYEARIAMTESLIEDVEKGVDF